MNRVFKVFLCLLLVTVKVSADDKPFDFYLPDQNEVNAFFNLTSYLDEYNRDTKKNIDEKQFEELLDIGKKYNVIQTYYLLDFIKNTNNQSVINYYINYCSSQKNIPPLYQIVLDVLTKQGSTKNTLSNGKYYENVAYSNFVEIGLFDGQLKTLLPDNQWQNFSIKNKSNQNDDKSITSFLCGGGTNSFLAMYRFYDETESEFITRVEKKRFDENKFDKVSLLMLPIDGFLKASNASKIYLWMGYSKDDFTIKNGQMVLNLYSSKYKKGYEITWLINFSEKNIFYINPQYIYSYMAEIILFNWVD